ncbi:hypothetical protein XS16_005262 [Salmonella enterica subsp. enterica serovar Newport]|nr:hypothetical protein [Salmonella enterica subsp. enterica serovar Newport]
MSEHKKTSESTKDITSFWEDVKNLSLATYTPVKASDEDDRIQDMHNKAIETLRNLYFNEINRQAEEVKKQRENAAKIARVVNIHIRNNVIGDGYFTRTVADTLIKYAEMIKSGNAGHGATEFFDDDNGNKVTIIGGRLSEEERIPSPVTGYTKKIRDSMGVY